MPTHYYGHYVSSTTTTTGCVEQFVTSSRTDSMFPPQLLRTCSLCDIAHNFRLKTIHMTATEKQRSELQEHFLSIEQDVSIQE